MEKSHDHAFIYPAHIKKNIVSHGNSSHLMIFGFLGVGEGDLFRLKGVRDGALLRLKADG